MNNLQTGGKRLSQGLGGRRVKQIAKQSWLTRERTINREDSPVRRRQESCVTRNRRQFRCRAIDLYSCTLKESLNFGDVWARRRGLRLIVQRRIADGDRFL